MAGQKARRPLDWAAARSLLKKEERAGRSVRAVKARAASPGRRPDMLSLLQIRRRARQATQRPPRRSPVTNGQKGEQRRPTAATKTRRRLLARTLHALRHAPIADAAGTSHVPPRGGGTVGACPQARRGRPPTEAAAGRTKKRRAHIRLPSLLTHLHGSWRIYWHPRVARRRQMCDACVSSGKGERRRAGACARWPGGGERGTAAPAGAALC